jgi:hypothetical protein
LNGFTHPAFEPYRSLLSRLQGRKDMDALNATAELLDIRHAQNGKILRFANLPGACSAAQYEQAIASSGIVPTRADNLHDFLNALVWLRFPLLKSTLNQRHCQTLAQQPEEGKQRGRLRDQLTLLDESGMLVISASSGLLELLRGKNWVELFWENRAEVSQNMRFIVVGHGLLEKCLAPFPGMTAKCLFLCMAESSPESLDAFAATLIRDAGNIELPPLPVQGVPGWDDNENKAYYQNEKIFRPVRKDLPAT